MVQKIIIENNIARVVNEEVVSEVPVSALESLLTVRTPVTMPILPSMGTTKFIHFDPTQGTGVLMVEVAPKMVDLRISHALGSQHPDASRADDQNISQFRVNTPYQLFVFRFSFASSGLSEAFNNFTISNVQLYWRKTPYAKLSDELFFAPVPNVDEHANICWGGTVRPHANFSEHIDALINEFYTSTFNEDLGHRTPFGTSLTDWEDASENLISYARWEWWNSAPRSTTISDIIGTEIVEPSMIEINPSFVALPLLPENFSLARAKEYLNNLPSDARARLTAAMDMILSEGVPA